MTRFENLPIILRDMMLKPSKKTGIQTSGSGLKSYVSFTTNPYRYLSPGLCNDFPFSVVCDSYIRIPISQIILQPVLYDRLRKTIRKQFPHPVKG
jgi:hypothetical protein